MTALIPKDICINSDNDQIVVLLGSNNRPIVVSIYSADMTIVLEHFPITDVLCGTSIVQYSKDRYIVLSSKDILCVTEKTKLEWKRDSHAQHPLSLLCDDDNNILVRDKNTIILLDSNGNRMKNMLSFYPGDIQKMQFDTSKKLVTLSKDGRITFWNYTSE